jgi:hypothetical protein
MHVFDLLYIDDKTYNLLVQKGAGRISDPARMAFIPYTMVEEFATRICKSECHPKYAQSTSVHQFTSDCEDLWHTFANINI